MDRQSAIEYYNKGLQYAKQKKWSEAVESLNKAIAENPEHANTYNVLGKVYIQEDRLDAARKCWHTALKLDPDNVTAQQCLAAVRKRMRVQVRKLLWLAIVAILFAALIITNSIWFFGILGHKQAMKIQDNGEKSPAYGNDQQSYPPNSIEETSSYRPPELETASQVTETYNQALVDCLSGKYDRAIEAFQQVLAYPPQHDLKDNAQYWLAECYYAQKKYIQALEEFRKVKEYFPKGGKVFDAELKIAYTYYRSGRIESAKDKLSQLSRDWPQQEYGSRIAILSQEIQSESGN